MQPNGLDTQVVDLAKAIRENESRGNFNARGASGEWGGYQFTQGTWDNYAKEAGVNAKWGEASPQQQNEVAYKKLKQWKDQGYNVGQIASMWNAGPGRPNAYAENWKGTNAYGVEYDTPAYAKKVAEAYQKYKSERVLAERKTQVPTTTTQPEQEPNFIQSLQDISTNRLGQASEAINRGLSGEQGVLSTVLQTAGAGAGGLLDVIGAGIKEVPVLGKGVEMAENLIGKGVEKAAETETGQAVMGAAQDFIKEHPTASANIGAAANIASAVPIGGALIRGGSLALRSPGLIKDALTPVAKKEAAAIGEIEKTIARRATGGQAIRSAERRGLNPIETIVKERLLPTIEKDAKGTPRYDINKADAQIEDVVDKLDDQLDDMLSKASMNLAGQVRLDDVKGAVLQEIEKEFKGSPDLKKVLGKVEEDFDSFKLSYNRDFVSLNELNRIKREVRKSVKFDTPSMDESARYHEGQVMMRIIEKVGESQGLADIRRINQEMANRLEAQRMLRKYVHGKSVMENPGFDWIIGRGTEPFAVAGAEAAGQATGIYGAGGLAGKFVSDKFRMAKPGAVEKLGTNRGIRREVSGIVKRKPLQLAVAGQLLEQEDPSRQQR